MGIIKQSMSIVLLVLCIHFGKLSAQSALANHDTQQAIDISAEDLNADNKQGRARFTGNVVVKQGGMILKSDDLLVFYDNPGGTGSPEISRLDATGLG